MRTTSKTLAWGAALLLAIGASSAQAYGESKVEITLTNLSQGVVLTPPIFALAKRPIELFEVGEPASLAIEQVAEGGDTSGVRAELEAGHAVAIHQETAPLLPGASVTVTLRGSRFPRLHLATMVLPTNDAFLALDGKRVWNGRVILLHAYDAGTEENTEICADIPGPQCGGAGMSEDGGEGHIAPHAGIHGEAELSRAAYGWGEPVARITVRTR